MSHYARMYAGPQIGNGLGEIEVYSGPIHHYHRQSGAGIGRYFANAFRFFRPLVTSGINALKDQGIKSSASILNQLGDKDLKSILQQESQVALKNLKQKAVNKINQATGIKTQEGAGMINTLSNLQRQRFASLQPCKKCKSKKKSIKGGRISKKSQSGKTYRVAQTGGKRKKTVKKNNQKGGIKRKAQIGGRKKSIKKKKKTIRSSKQLDIFD